MSYDIQPLRPDEGELSQKEIRVRRCMEEIKASLDRWGCCLDISVLVTSRGNLPNLEVVPKEDFQGPPEGLR